MRAYHDTYGLPALITNCSNNYGPYQFPEKLIPLMILNALEGKPLPIYGDGGNVRDWLHVEDHCRGDPGGAAARAAGREVQPRRAAASGPTCRSWTRICDLLEAERPAAGNPALGGRGIASYRDLKTFVADRPGHDRRYAIDDDEDPRASSAGRRGTTSTRASRATVRWYLANRAWCEAVQTGRYGRERLGLGETESEVLAHEIPSNGASGGRPRPAGRLPATTAASSWRPTRSGKYGAAGLPEELRPGQPLLFRRAAPSAASTPSSASRRGSSCASSRGRSSTWRSTSGPAPPPSAAGWVSCPSPRCVTASGAARCHATIVVVTRLVSNHAAFHRPNPDVVPRSVLRHAWAHTFTGRGNSILWHEKDRRAAFRDYLRALSFRPGHWPVWCSMLRSLITTRAPRYNPTMRIVHLIHSEGVYGAEQILLYLAREQQWAGHVALIGSIRDPATPQTAFEARAADIWDCRSCPSASPRVPLRVWCARSCDDSRTQTRRSPLARLQA